MKNINKIVILFLTMVFLLLTFCSCGSETENPKTGKIALECVEVGYTDYYLGTKYQLYRDTKTDLLYIMIGGGSWQTFSPLYRTPTEVYTYEQWKEDYLEVENK